MWGYRLLLKEEGQEEEEAEGAGEDIRGEEEKGGQGSKVKNYC